MDSTSLSCLLISSTVYRNVSHANLKSADRSAYRMDNSLISKLLPCRIFSRARRSWAMKRCTAAVLGWGSNSEKASWIETLLNGDTSLGAGIVYSVL